MDDHLTNATTYDQVSEADAHKAGIDIYTEIYKWMWDNKLSLSLDATYYSCYWTQKNTSDPFGHFYLMVKIHKSLVSTRPVCSDCASLIHSLKKWLDYALQPIITSQPSYFKDSFSLKQELDKIALPPKASIIRFDAISIFTNINIDNSIEQILTFIANIWDKHECKAVKKAMEIVMKNN